MPNPKPQTEYELVQEQIRQRKIELRRNGFPEQMYELWSSLRMHPGHVTRGRNAPLHPQISEVNAFPSGLVNFTFKGQYYEIDFHEGAPSFGTVSGTLTIRRERDEVMKSSFSAVDGEYGTEKFTYNDSSVFKKAAWVEDLSCLQREYTEVRDAARKRDVEGPENLAALRAQFGIPSSPPPRPLSAPTSSFWRKLFRR